MPAEGPDYDEIDPGQQATVRARWAERMTAQRAELNFEREFTQAGAAYAELDEHGRAVLREPAPDA